MMKQSDGKIGTREFIALILLAVGLKLTDITPSVLYPFGKTATWMLPIVSGLLIIPPFLLLLSLLKRYKNKGLMDIIFHLTGKYIGFVIGMVLFIFMLVTTVLYSRSFVDVMGNLYLPKTPAIALYIVIMVGTYLITNRGLEAIGRTSWLVVPYLTIIFAVLLFFVWKDLNWRNLFPLGGSGMTEVIRGGTRHSFILGEIILFSILFPFVRTYKDFRLASLLGLGITLFEVVLFFAIYVMMYNYPSIESIAYPFQLLTRIVDLGPIFANAESFFLGFWVIASIVRLAIYLYVTVAIFSYTLRIKEFEPLLLPFAVVILFLGLIPESNIETLFVLRESLLFQINWLFILCLPILLWVIAQFKGERVI
jgi:spore germination protein (amino acid permease)